MLQAISMSVMKSVAKSIIRRSSQWRRDAAEEEGTEPMDEELMDEELMDEEPMDDAHDEELTLESVFDCIFGVCFRLRLWDVRQPCVTRLSLACERQSYCRWISRDIALFLTHL